MPSLSSLARLTAAVSCAVTAAVLLLGPVAASRARPTTYAAHHFPPAGHRSGSLSLCFGRRPPRRRPAPRQRGASPDATNLDLAPLGGYWQQRLPAHHGGNPIRGGRRVAILPGRTWPHHPENCRAGMLDSLAVLDGHLLLCGGCGINAT